MLSRAGSLEGAKQAVKTAIAGAISMYVTRVFHWPEGYWAAISALIVMQSNVGATLNASRSRLAGTAVGAVIAGLFVALFGANMLTFALAVAIAFFVCGVLDLAESQRLATVTVAIIMLTGRANAAWTVALHRFSEVALGIIIALLVSLTLWPNHARRSVRQGLAEALVRLNAFYQAVMHKYRLEEATSIEKLKSESQQTLGTIRGLLQNALQEAFGPLKERESLALLTDQVERIFRAVETLEFAVRDSSVDSYYRTFEAGLLQLEGSTSGALVLLSKSIAMWKIQAEWPDLKEAFESLDQQAAQARKEGATMHYALDEILRFYSLLLSSRNLISELELMHAVLATRLPGSKK